MQNNSETILEIKNLGISFNGRQILHGLSTEIKKGDVISVIGPSGCGKSTFLRCLNRLEHPTEGEIIYKGKNILAPDADINSVRRKIGMVFQHFNLFPNMTVLDNIILAPVKLGGMNKTEAEQKALSFLDMLNLADKAKSYPSTLSGGQKQRIAIARAIANDPDAILFDEPTSALDPEMVGEVLDMMKDLAGKHMTMIVVTHEMSFAKQVANRAFFIDGGKIALDATPAEFFENQDHPRLKEFLSRTNIR